jgi:hypothetical protein
MRTIGAAIGAMTLVLAIGCTTKHRREPSAADQPAAEVIGVAKAFADQACACGESMKCLHEVRDRWDTQKASLVANPSFTPADTAALAEQGKRIAMCGDGGGVTFWP